MRFPKAIAAQSQREKDLEGEDNDLLIFCGPITKMRATSWMERLFSRGESKQQRQRDCDTGISNLLEDRGSSSDELKSSSAVAFLFEMLANLKPVAYHTRTSSNQFGRAHLCHIDQIV